MRLDALLRYYHPEDVGLSPPGEAVSVTCFDCGARFPSTETCPACDDDAATGVGA